MGVEKLCGSETFTKVNNGEYQVNGISQEADGKRSSWSIVFTNNS